MILEEETTVEPQSSSSNHNSNPSQPSPGLTINTSPDIRQPGPRVEFQVTSPMDEKFEKASANGDSRYPLPPSSAATNEADPYTKITTPSVQRPESYQITPTNRIFLKNKNGMASNRGISSGGSANNNYYQHQQDTHGFLEPHTNQQSNNLRGSGQGYGNPNMPQSTAILALGSMMAGINKPPQPQPGAGGLCTLTYLQVVLT